MTETPLEEAYYAAAAEAIAAYPVRPASIELVAVSENVTFRVHDANARHDLVLRLHRPGYNSLPELEAERRWTQTLADVGLDTPTGLRTDDGRSFVQITVARTGEQRFAGVTRWMPGRPLDELLQDRAPAADWQDAYRRIGAIAARMHGVAQSWTPPEAFTRPRLDAEGLLGEAPRWGRFWEHPGLAGDARRHLAALRKQLAAEVEAYGDTTDSFGLIHADLHAENIIIAESGATGIIDFDDTAWGWYVYDLATALVDHWGEPGYAALREALLSGYCAERALPDRDVAMLDRFVLLRACTLIGWYAARPEHGDAEYFWRITERVLSQPLRGPTP